MLIVARSRIGPQGHLLSPDTVPDISTGSKLKDLQKSLFEIFSALCDRYTFGIYCLPVFPAVTGHEPPNPSSF
jgi:hypothetical protein